MDMGRCSKRITAYTLVIFIEAKLMAKGLLSSQMGLTTTESSAAIWRNVKMVSFVPKVCITKEGSLTTLSMDRVLNKAWSRVISTCSMASFEKARETKEDLTGMIKNVVIMVRLTLKMNSMAKVSNRAMQAF